MSSSRPLSQRSSQDSEDEYSIPSQLPPSAARSVPGTLSPPEALHYREDDGSFADLNPDPFDFPAPLNDPSPPSALASQPVPELSLPYIPPPRAPPRPPSVVPVEASPPRAPPRSRLALPPPRIVRRVSSNVALRAGLAAMEIDVGNPLEAPPPLEPGTPPQRPPVLVPQSPPRYPVRVIRLDASPRRYRRRVLSDSDDEVPEPPPRRAPPPLPPPRRRIPPPPFPGRLDPRLFRRVASGPAPPVRVVDPIEDTSSDEEIVESPPPPRR
jgi:hypothetical protein